MSLPEEVAADRCAAIVSSAAIAANCRLLCSRLTGSAELCAVVKADGYGHGAGIAARAALAGGAGSLAVVSAAEALELRGLVGTEPSILVMGPVAGREIGAALDARAEIGAWDEHTIRAVSQLAQERGGTARIHVKHDSGMGRLGERDPDEVARLVGLLDELEGVEPHAVWTHFATADEPGSEWLARQLESFLGLVERLREERPDLRAHAANSAATLVEPASHLDMVRCGVAVYGLDPFQVDPTQHGLEPALELVSRLASVKRVEEGAPIGYGRSWRAPSERWVGLVPAGYGDGFRRGLSGGADVLLEGVRHPLVGTISMDSVTVDLGPDGDAAERGAEAVLLGRRGSERILAEDLARRLGTINYEITCGLTARVPRVERSEWEVAG